MELGVEFIVLGLMLVASVAFPTSVEVGEETLYCTQEDCMEGTEAYFVSSVTNNKDISIIVLEVEVENGQGTIICTEDSYRTAIVSGDAASFSCIDNLPEPSSGSTLYYKYCTTYEYQGWWDNPVETECSAMYHKTILPRSEVECQYDSDCASDEQCLNYKCKEMSCGYCEYAAYHRCNTYECCSDDECYSDEECLSNSCEKISCTEGYIQNHMCIEYECSSNRDCDDNQECSSHYCMDVTCSNGIINNHACVECLSDSDCTYGNCINNVCEKNETKGTGTPCLFTFIILAGIPLFLSFAGTGWTGDRY